jgi:hypothetical protein
VIAVSNSNTLSASEVVSESAASAMRLKVMREGSESYSTRELSAEILIYGILVVKGEASNAQK